MCERDLLRCKVLGEDTSATEEQLQGEMCVAAPACASGFCMFKSGARSLRPCCAVTLSFLVVVAVCLGLFNSPEIPGVLCLERTLRSLKGKGLLARNSHPGLLEV